jgi:hypothetical protein
MLELAIMSLKPRLNISSCVNGGIVFLENCIVEITRGTWLAPDYPICSRSALQQFGYEW